MFGLLPLDDPLVLNGRIPHDGTGVPCAPEAFPGFEVLIRVALKPCTDAVGGLKTQRLAVQVDGSAEKTKIELPSLK